MTGVQTCALPICFPVTIGGILDSEEYAFFEEHLNPSIYDCLESKIEPCGIVSMWESCKTYIRRIIVTGKRQKDLSMII